MLDNLSLTSLVLSEQDFNAKERESIFDMADIKKCEVVFLKGNSVIREQGVSQS